jgi:ABC-type glycerol-3-phosphate transport system permease component
MKYKPSLSDIIFDFFLYVFFTLFALACIFPFYYIIINSISDNYLAETGQILLYPRGIHLSNYIEVMRLPQLPMATFISVSRTLLGTALNVVVTAFAGYAVSKRELWHRKLVYRFFIITMYFHAGLIPGYLNMRRLGLLNNYLIYIISILSVYNMILVKTYIESIPASLEESAEIDGAGYLRIFAQIMLPLCKPILATIAIFTAVGHWNSFMDTVIYIRDSRLFTLQYILYQYLRQSEMLVKQMMLMSGSQTTADIAQTLTPLGVRMTITAFVSLPVLFIYPFFQKYFVRGIMIGAVKG